jgi:hypothetical protein
MTQQYFGSLAAGATEILADNTGSKVTIAAGTNIAVSANPATATLTISVTGGLSAELPVTQDNDTNATNYVVFNAATSGSLAPKVDSGLYYNPATGILAVTGIRFGDASIASTASQALAIANFNFKIAGDDSTQRTISLNETVKFVGSGGITTASDTEGNITITGPSLAGLATETYVTTRGYITSSALTGLATESYVTSRGYITGLSWNQLTDKPNLAGTYTFNVAADDSTMREISSEETVKFVGSGGITTASDTEGNITITATSTPTITGGSITGTRINPRAVAAGATSGTLTPNGDTTDVFNAFGLTGTITVNTPSGTPVDGQRLMLRFEDNGSGRNITWTTSSGAYRAVGTTLPTTTVASKVTYVGCVYNSTDIFWDAIAVATQA